ncbi:jg23317, partial [Pararge aegeria aegeria]
MHMHTLRVRLERLSPSSYALPSPDEPTSSSASEETARPKRKRKKPVKRLKNTPRIAESSRVLRSMRRHSAYDEEDTRPLASYNVKEKIIKKPLKRGRPRSGKFYHLPSGFFAAMWKERIIDLLKILLPKWYLEFNSNAIILKFRMVMDSFQHF